MIDSALICNKFAEISTQYKDKNIDNFDAFVCARVADYFINTENVSTTEVYDTIKAVLLDPSEEAEASKVVAAIPVEKETGSNKDTTADTEATPETASTSNKTDTSILKTLGKVVVVTVAVIGTAHIVSKATKKIIKRRR